MILLLLLLLLLLPGRMTDSVMTVEKVLYKSRIRSQTIVLYTCIEKLSL